jgi:hypothetical protein
MASIKKADSVLKNLANASNYVTSGNVLISEVDLKPASRVACPTNSQFFGEDNESAKSKMPILSLLEFQLFFPK